MEAGSYGFLDVRSHNRTDQFDPDDFSYAEE